MHRFAIASIVLVLVLVLALPLRAQDHQHTPGMQHSAAGAQPKEGGQAAFASIAEIVKLLDADPRTDLDEMTMRAAVRSEPIEGGAAFIVSGGVRFVALGDHHAPHHLGIANGSIAGMHGH